MTNVPPHPPSVHRLFSDGSSVCGPTCYLCTGLNVQDRQQNLTQRLTIVSPYSLFCRLYMYLQGAHTHINGPPLPR